MMIRTPIHVPAPLPPQRGWMSEKNPPLRGREKCFFLTSPFIEPTVLANPSEIKRLGHPPLPAARAIVGRSHAERPGSESRLRKKCSVATGDRPAVPRQPGDWAEEFPLP